MSASGVTWSARLHAWVTDEEAEAELAEAERASNGSGETAVVGGVGESGIGGEKGEKEGIQGGAAMGRKLTVAEQMEADGVIWAEWDGPDDPANPYNWSARKKWTTTWIVCFFTMAVAFSGAALPSGNASMTRDLACSNELAAMAFAAFPLGFGIGPLALAPFSEAYGRYYVYCVSCFLYLIFLIPIARAENIATVIVARLLAGIAGSTGSTLVGGSIADLFDSSVRGTPMSLFSVAAFGGTGAGPLVSGFVEDAWGWRGIEYVQLVMAGVLFVSIVTLTRETRGSVILSRRAAKKRKETGDSRYQCRSDAERASLAILIKNSMTRPVYLLCTEATVAAFSLFIGFAWGILYLCLEAVPFVMQGVYGFSAGQSGAVFATVVIAALIGGVTNIYQEKLYKRHVAKRGPEARLYACMVGGLMFPSGIFIFAFSQGRGHWAGPCVGLIVVRRPSPSLSPSALPC